MTPDWICEGGHPLYLIDGEKYCPICVAITEKGLKPRGRSGPTPCAHTMPTGVKSCYVCERYRKSPWLQELDENGRGTCPGGHEVTHADLSYGIRGQYAQRRCAACAHDSVLKASRAFMKKKDEIAAAEGRKVRRRTDPKVRLPVDYIDWVVALRLIEGKVDEVYDMNRGGHVGATAMEKWVAYHSTTDLYSYTRTTPTGPTHVRYQWVDMGVVKKWKPTTLAQAMSNL